MPEQFTWNITRPLAVLSTNEKSGWAKEANLVSWNGGQEKLDIRDWSPDHSKMSRGVTLTSDEARTLMMALNNLLR